MRIVGMRRITQVVALMVALLLVGQSALAEASCARWMHSDIDYASACCDMATMDSHQLNATCQTPARSASLAAQCDECGCQLVSDGAMIQSKASPETKAQKAAALAAVILLPARSLAPLKVALFAAPPAPGPAKHLLHSVFRI
jgi:hypothetical protein